MDVSYSKFLRRSRHLCKTEAIPDLFTVATSPNSTLYLLCIYINTYIILYINTGFSRICVIVTAISILKCQRMLPIYLYTVLTRYEYIILNRAITLNYRYLYFKTCIYISVMYVCNAIYILYPFVKSRNPYDPSAYPPPPMEISKLFRTYIYICIIIIMFLRSNSNTLVSEMCVKFFIHFSSILFYVYGGGVEYINVTILYTYLGILFDGGIKFHCVSKLTTPHWVSNPTRSDIKTYICDFK